jgi:hypothetical protein
VKFLVDENLSPQHAAIVREHGHDASKLAQWLDSDYAMYTRWGPEFTQFYNDA